MVLQPYVITTNEGQRVPVITADSLLSTMEDLEYFHGATKESIVQHYYDLKRAANEVIAANNQEEQAGQSGEDNQNTEGDGGGVGEPTTSMGKDDPNPKQGMDMQRTRRSADAEQGKRDARPNKPSALPRP